MTTKTSVKAIWRGEVIAESERTKTRSDRACPHGVQFYDLVQGDERSERAAWSYEAPGAAMASIDHWIGFWEDVEVG